MRFVDSKQRTGYAEVRNKAGDLLTGYQYGDFAFHPYCHPVSLPNGKSLTLTAPADHPWHHGVAFAWKYLNGYNVWDFEATRGLARCARPTTAKVARRYAPSIPNAA